LRRHVAEGAQGQPVGRELRSDTRTEGTVREMPLEPGGLLDVEIAGHPLGEPQTSAFMR
jgi:hypothetical protein